MSERKETTKMLSAMLEEYLNPKHDPRIYTSKEVTFDYGTPFQRRVDYMRFKPLNNFVSGLEKGDVYCYEIKSCKADFESSNGHNMLGDYNYYVMPKETYDEMKEKIAYKCGVICPENGRLKVIRTARRMDRKKPLIEILFMMFRSANRDVLKAEASSDKKN